MKKILILLFCVSSYASAQTSTMVDPATRIAWPRITGAGAPTSSCTAVNYGQPYLNVSMTPNVAYRCGSDGWQIIGSGVGAGVNYSNYGGVNTYGDSITQSTGAANFMQYGLNADGYAQDLIADFGGNGQNFGYGGDQAADISLKVFANANVAAANNAVTTIMVSTNDVNVYGANADAQNIFVRSLTGAIGWASIPDTSKFLTSNTNNCTQTGTWTGDGGSPRPALYSITAASTLSCSVTVPAGSSSIYYGYTACDGFYPGSAAITINGSSPSTDATINSYGQGDYPIATGNGSSCSHFVARYPVSPGTYTFLITVNSGGGYVEPLWLGSPSPAAAQASAPPLVLVGGTPWNEGDSPSTTTAAYNTLISTTANSMNADGAPVYFVNIRNGTNTRNSNTATPLNSTTDYAGGVQGTVTCPASAFLPLHPNSSTTWSRSCGHGHLAANFEAALGIKAGGPSANEVVSGRLLNPNGFYAGETDVATSLNGDLRYGSLVGMFYDPTNGNLHLDSAGTASSILFDIGNVPAPGVAPTVTHPCSIATTGLACTAIADTALTTAGYVTNDASGNLGTVAGIAPTGAAGGDLSGTYPNPTVAAIHAVSGTFDGGSAGATTPLTSVTTTALTATGATIGGMPMSMWASGTAAWIQMPSTGPSGIGTGGPGANPWIALASGPGYWVTDAAAGDVVYKNTGGCDLFGNSGGNSAMQVCGNVVSFGSARSAQFDYAGNLRVPNIFGVSGLALRGDPASGSGITLNGGMTVDGIGDIAAPGVSTSILVATNSNLSGQVTLVAGTGSFTFTPPFGSAPYCVATDTSSISPVRVVTTATSITITSTGLTDTVNYFCPSHG